MNRLNFRGSHLGCEFHCGTVLLCWDITNCTSSFPSIPGRCHQDSKEGKEAPNFMPKRLQVSKHSWDTKNRSHLSHDLASNWSARWDAWTADFISFVVVEWKRLPVHMERHRLCFVFFLDSSWGWELFTVLSVSSFQNLLYVCDCHSQPTFSLECIQCKQGFEFNFHLGSMKRNVCWNNLVFAAKICQN